MSRPEIRQLRPEPDPETLPPDLAALLSQVAPGDHRAFELVYAGLCGPVYGVVRQVLRDPAAALEYQRVRRCMDGLTGLQRESIKLAYYSGYSYPQVAQLLGVALGTVKTRIRDGLIRMRDCMEVTG